MAFEPALVSPFFPSLMNGQLGYSTFAVLSTPCFRGFLIMAFAGGTLMADFSLSVSARA
jgi:hypothetical protein